jgi:hypothetical protein
LREFGEEILDQAALTIELANILAGWFTSGVEGIMTIFPAAASGWSTHSSAFWTPCRGEQCVSLYLRQQMVSADQIMRSAPHRQWDGTSRIAQRIDGGLDLGAQSIARVSDRFVSAGFFRPCTVLMGSHDGAVDHRILIFSIGHQLLKDPLPDAGCAQPLKRRSTFFRSPKRSGKPRQGIPSR